LSSIPLIPTQAASPIPAIAIVGATASGKTATSLALVRLLQRQSKFESLFDGIAGAEIISADSRQIYRYLTIGTAKPSADELQEIPHHFVDCKNPDEIYSAGEFGTDAAARIDTLLAQKRFPIIVGGSGLYVQALCEGLFDEAHPVDTSAARIQLEERLENEGISTLYKELRKVDLVLAERYNDMNPRRIVRALEYFYTTGIPLSEAQNTFETIRTFPTLYFGIDVERETLYDRINARTAAMFGINDDDGIIAETAQVLALGYKQQPNQLNALNSLNTVGYKEAIAYLKGELTRQRALELAQQHTRHYAKRQMTWFRRNTHIHWFQGTPEEIAAQILTALGTWFAERHGI
jgi:tRNA dimethylallyltransferase